MDIRDYEYIVAIAEQESISRAAAQLFITQPALTKFLQRTEKNLGVSLFHRKGNKFLLTEIGRKYVETGRKIMRLDHQLTDQLDSAVAAQNSRIRLGYGMGRTTYLIETILPEFYKKFPNTQIYGKATTSYQQIAEIQNGRLDMALVSGVERLPGYTYLPVDKTYLALAVSDHSPLLKQAYEDDDYPYPVIPLEVLSDISLIALPVTTNSGYLAKELFQEKNLSPKIILELSDVRSLFDAIECDLGVSVFLSVPFGNRKIRYLSLEGVEPMEQTTSLIYKADKNLNAGMKYLIQLMVSQP